MVTLPTAVDTKTTATTTDGTAAATADDTAATAASNAGALKTKGDDTKGAAGADGARHAKGTRGADGAKHAKRSGGHEARAAATTTSNASPESHEGDEPAVKAGSHPALQR
jgi:hypothetical protein